MKEFLSLMPYIHTCN